MDANDPPDTLEVNFVVGFTPADPCLLAFTPIPDIQGNGATTPLAGQVVTTQGGVVGDYGGPSPALRGFFLQAQQADNDPTTSDGIRSLVNWIRRKSQSTQRARVRARSVLPMPGTPSMSA